MRRLDALVVAACVATFPASSRSQPAAPAPAPAPPAPSAVGSGEVRALSGALEALASRIMPSVVQIQAKGYAPVEGGEEGGLLARRSSAGSGVVLDADGYVITNAHVVLGARSIQVQLAPEHRTPHGTSILKPRGKVLGAQLVGVDRETDLAVLKVESGGLPALKLGDSESLQQGQLVLAFGSPFGLEGSLTMGVVSSVARQVEPDHPMVYIQTDAAINPGNSGGPLVDADGNVVGINTFIITRSGGNEGVGFAAPSNIVRNVYEQLRSTGHVRRGMLGINAQSVTPALAAGLRLPRDWGAVLSDVAPGGSAAGAGLRIGDLVNTLDGKPIENARQLEVNIYRRKVGEKVELEVQRGSETLRFQVPVVERNNNSERFMDLVTPERNVVPKLGVLGLDLDGNIAKMMTPPPRRNAGVVVAVSSLGSFRREELFLPGDIIYALNGAAVNGLESLRGAVAKLRSGDPVVAQVERRGQLLYVAFEAE
jgi:serine protease Do